MPDQSSKLYGGRFAIFGASGAIGGALARQLAEVYSCDVYAFARRDLCFNHQNITALPVDFENEETLLHLANAIGEEGPLSGILVATGFLHSDTIQPEKSLKQLSAENMQQNFFVNAVIPALVAKHFSLLLNHKAPAVFAALSARVGSIEDNRLGGWYSYRASKAALNMLIKTMAIEIHRRRPLSTIIGLHPGTVDSALSSPFQKNISPEKLFRADYAAENIIKILEAAAPEDSGKIFAWDGKIIPY